MNRIIPKILILVSFAGLLRAGGGRIQAPPAVPIAVPRQALPFPTPAAEGAEPGFKIRGIKGWAWTWDQYLAEIPTLVRGRMNFLMSCYTSVFSGLEPFVNRWWEPLPEETRSGISRLARACRENGIAFCFSMHPALFTERPLRTDSDADFEALMRNYLWVQSRGVRWFSLSYDDIDSRGQDPAVLGRAHARLANRLRRELLLKDAGAELIFCPVHYWGCGDAPAARSYLEALGRELDPGAYVFWTGDAVVTPRITRACAEAYRKIVGHRLILWDNYPVNDRSGALHLGPVTGRDPGLARIVDGYMSNPLCPQNEINRIPLLTCADYAFNPVAYDPARSIGQAILLQTDSPEGRAALRDLVEIYPGHLMAGSDSTAFNNAAATFRSLLRTSRERAAAFLGRLEDAAARLNRCFPDRYAATKSTLAAHVAALRKELSGPAASRELVLTREALRDKIMGGWAGQTIGCTFGGPTEFRFPSTFIPDYQPIPWSEDAVASSFSRSPGLYDDVYMDLTFVEVFEKLGLDAPAAAFARAFADAPYPLWHANQMARYNIQSGLPPPQSGHWLRNPHADDIDFQIEADFAGLMAPGLPNAAAVVCDRVGHIMNYGDGWYGGVYMAALYALAFVHDDPAALAEEALKIIPARSGFARTMREVLAQYRRDPEDWKAAWFRVERRFGEDVGCPEGVFSTFNIDAKINAAWVLVGLLYGRGDFGRTMDIAARCGDDSDCNPASAAGILGVLRGYSGIPESWRRSLAAVEDTPFPYVGISLRKAAELSAKHARAMVLRHGGADTESGIRVAVQDPEPVAFEAGFAGLVPRERRSLRTFMDKEWAFEFRGSGFALGGEAEAGGGAPRTFRIEARIDGGPVESFDLPTDGRLRRETLFWKYTLADGPHRVELKILNPAPPAGVRPAYLIVYGPAPDAGAR